MIDGSGIKTPGKGRVAQKRSSWGVFHPGRKFVGKLALAASRLTEMAIVAKIDDFFAARLSEADKLKPSADSGDEVEY